MFYLSLELGTYHPLLVHFPIVLIFELVVLEIFLIRTPFGFWNRFSLWLSTTASFFTAIALLTGWFAAKNYAEDDYLRMHRLLGFVLLGILLLFVVIKILETKKQERYLKACSGYLCVAMFIVLFVTADYGGILTRGVTPFRKKEMPPLEDLISPKLEFIIRDRISPEQLFLP